MAFQSFYNEEELKNQQAQPGAPSTGASSNVLSGNSSSASAGQPAAPQSSVGTGFVNLQKYIDGNANQGGGLANVVTQGVGNNINAAKTGAIDWGTQAKGRVDQGTVGVDNGLVSQIKTDPTKVSGDQFKNYMGQSYSGINDAKADSGYGSVLGSFKNAGNQLNNITDRNTQKSTLMDSSQAPGNALNLQPSQRYTQGFANLDSFILNGDKAGQQGLSDFKTANTGFDSNLDKSVGDVNSYIGGAAGRGDANKNVVKQAVTDSRTSMQNDIANRVKARQAEDNGAYNQLREKYTGDASKYITFNNRAVQDTDVMTDESLARMAALSSLSGDANPWAGKKTTQFNGAGFDETRFKADTTVAHAKAEKLRQADAIELQRQQAEAAKRQRDQEARERAAANSSQNSRNDRNK